MSMTEEELRLECLKLAHDREPSAEAIVTRARIYSDYLLGKRDAEVIDAARDLAEKVRD